MTKSTAAARVVSRPEFIGLVAAIMALNSLAIDVMLPALPNIGASLGVANENERQLVIVAYMLGFGIAQLGFGPLSDRFGRRAPLLAGIGIYVVAAFFAAVAPNFTILLILRLVQGLGAAATRVVATSVVRDRFVGRANRAKGGFGDRAHCTRASWRRCCQAVSSTSGMKIAAVISSMTTAAAAARPRFWACQ